MRDDMLFLIRADLIQVARMSIWWRSILIWQDIGRIRKLIIAAVTSYVGSGTPTFRLSHYSSSRYPPDTHHVSLYAQPEGR